MEINKMTFTKYLLTILDNSNYGCIERSGTALYALKWFPFDDEFDIYEFAIEFSCEDDFIDTAFFEKYFDNCSKRDLQDVIKDYEDYCREYQKEQEDTDSNFVKFLKDEMNSIVDLFKRKSKAYGSNEDVFHNFRQSARRIYNDDSVNSMFMIAETLKDKHNVALAKGADVPECAERLRDNIVYSLIQLAMLQADDTKEA